MLPNVISCGPANPGYVLPTNRGAASYECSTIGMRLYLISYGLERAGDIISDARDFDFFQSCSSLVLLTDPSTTSYIPHLHSIRSGEIKLSQVM